MAAACRLVLWDIDRTLLNVSDLIAEAIAAAAADVLGAPPSRLAPIVGRPETAIMLDTLIVNGMSEQTARDRLPAALALLTGHLRQRVPRFLSEGKVMPGVRVLLRLVAGDPGTVQSVLTGSLRANALRKLRAFDLDADLDLEVGAYGDDAFDRPSLVGIARSRAGQRYGTGFDGPATVLVGDSLHDVEAGRSSGARVIGVATGVVSARQLREAGAEVVFDDLSDTAQVLASLAGGTRSGR